MKKERKDSCTIRVAISTRDIIKHEAECQGISMSDFVERRLVTVLPKNSRKQVPMLSKKAKKELVAPVNRVGSNLHQMVKHLNSIAYHANHGTGRETRLSDIELADLYELIDDINVALGRIDEVCNRSL
jgi:uncharacterized protein (DUF1778 family)